MSESLVLGAVQNRDRSSRSGILQRLFALWFDAFVYNQIWEDPRVDLKALELGPDSRILAISSGGCNALNYLLAGPAKVTAIDLNRNHIFLLDLKIAAIRGLADHADFFSLFGAGKCKRSESLYRINLKPWLDDATKDFWESNTLGGSLVFGNRLSFFSNAGLYDHSRNGYFLRFFHSLARLLGCDPASVLAASSIDEQIKLYERNIDPFFDSLLIKAIGRLPITVFGLGIPPQQYDELRKELSAGGSVVDIFRERTRRLACDFTIKENYFAWQAFARKYDTEDRIAIPDYLKEENFTLLQTNIDRIETKIGSITREIETAPRHTFDRFVLLDAQDWMNPEQLRNLWSAIAERGGKDSRVIFRTAGSASPLEGALPKELLDRFVYERAISNDLFKDDRASIYGGFHLYVLK